MRTTDLPSELLCLLLGFVAFGGRDLTSGKLDHPVRHLSDDGIVRDDCRGRAEFAIGARNRVEYGYACGRIQRPRGFVAQENVRLFGNGACDGDTLLLTSRKLSGEMIHAFFSSNQRQGVLGRHGISRDVSDKGDVLLSREAGDEVVELKDEADMLASIVGELGIGEMA